jgi:uncharacterized protein (TIGR00661 family)
MRILYGVQGTGNGHITRARHMAGSIANHTDIQVDYLFSGRQAGEFFDMQAFSQYQTKRGLSFVAERGQIRHLKTVMNNNLFSFVKEVSTLNIKQYDLVINDFEPVTAWAAKKAGVPSLSISHQAAFLHDIPRQNQSPVDKMITKNFAPTTYSLGTHWYHFGFDIIPPFVSQDLVRQAQAFTQDLGKQNYVLVYLPFESLADIRTQLQILSNTKFVCYHPSIQTSRLDHNISWYPMSRSQFKIDLVKCNGVISNCGFELSTECLSIGKPLLVKPLRKQYEQLSNAYTLQKLGLCSVINELLAHEIDDWLNTKQGVKVDFPTNCNTLVDWILEGNWHSTDKICQSLWRQVSFPKQLENKLNTSLTCLR